MSELFQIPATYMDRARYRRSFRFAGGEIALEGFLLDPCSAILDSSMQGAHETASDADKAWHRRRRKIQAELNQLEAKARSAAHE